NVLGFIHVYFLSKKAEKPLEEYTNPFPKTYSLSLLDESNVEAEQVELPKVEDANNLSTFPLLNAIITKGLGVLNQIEGGISVYDSSDIEIIEAIRKERDIL